MIGRAVAFVAGVLTTYAAIAIFFRAEQAYFDRLPAPSRPDVDAVMRRVTDIR